MSDVAASGADLGGPQPDQMPVLPTPPTLVIGAGASHNSGIAQEWMPDLATSNAAATSAAGQVTAIVGAYQAQAGQFIAENGASVLGGHAPVGMAASDIAGPSDLGSPVSGGTTDNTLPASEEY